MEAAVSTAAEHNSLPVCLLGSLRSHLIHKHGGTVEKYVFYIAQSYWNLVLYLRGCHNSYN